MNEFVDVLSVLFVECVGFLFIFVRGEVLDDMLCDCVMIEESIVGIKIIFVNLMIFLDVVIMGCV